MSAYRIISFDGGGIRGLLTAVLLARLEEEIPDIVDNAHLLAGTSTGGIIALGLASGLDGQDLCDLYYDHGAEIFHDSLLDDFLDLGQAIGAEYSNDRLREMVMEVVGNRSLADLNKRVLISAFDLDNEDPNPARRTWKPKFFHNFPGGDSDGPMPAHKVALYTSAAPTYFPTVDGFVDGGVVANNPSMAALAQAQDRRAFPDPRQLPRLDEIALLSFGTGDPHYFIRGQSHNWGYAQWVRPIINVMLDGSMGLADFQCRQFLGERYHRLSPTLPESIQLDDCHKIDRLMEIGKAADLEPTLNWLRAHWV